MQNSRKYKIIIAILAAIIIGLIITVVVIANNSNNTNDIVSTSTKTGKSNSYKVTFNVTETEYNHLGTDISYAYYCNDSAISNGAVVKPNASGKINLKIVITEDDKIPDVGTGNFSFDANGKSNSKRTTIRVNESGGTKYKDAYAVFDVTANIEPQ